jgi:hypothetical protein
VSKLIASSLFVITPTYHSQLAFENSSFSESQYISSSCRVQHSYTDLEGLIACVITAAIIQASALSNRATRNILILLTRCDVCLGPVDDSSAKGPISASGALQTK